MGSYEPVLPQGVEFGSRAQGTGTAAGCPDVSCGEASTLSDSGRGATVARTTVVPHSGYDFISITKVRSCVGSFFNDGQTLKSASPRPDHVGKVLVRFGCNPNVQSGTGESHILRNFFACASIHWPVAGLQERLAAGACPERTFAAAPPAGAQLTPGQLLET